MEPVKPINGAYKPDLSKNNLTSGQKDIGGDTPKNSKGSEFGKLLKEAQKRIEDKESEDER